MERQRISDLSHMSRNHVSHVPELRNGSAGARMERGYRVFTCYGSSIREIDLAGPRDSHDECSLSLEVLMGVDIIEACPPSIPIAPQELWVSLSTAIGSC